jgi:hypothetical protein
VEEGKFAYNKVVGNDASPGLVGERGSMNRGSTDGLAASGGSMSVIMKDGILLFCSPGILANIMMPTFLTG